MNKLLIMTALRLSNREKAILNIIKEQKIANHASKIATSARIPRTTAIYILEKLARWKLIRKIRSGKHWVWLDQRA